MGKGYCKDPRNHRDAWWTDPNPFSYYHSRRKVRYAKRTAEVRCEKCQNWWHTSNKDLVATLPTTRPSLNKGPEMNANATMDRNLYGARETNGLVNGTEYHQQVDYGNRMTLKQVQDAGGKITRLRVLEDYVPMAGRFCDISYCHATLPDGTVVDVQVGVGGMVPKQKFMGVLIDWAKSEGVFAKGIGLLDKGNWSTLD